MSPKDSGRRPIGGTNRASGIDANLREMLEEGYRLENPGWEPGMCRFCDGRGRHYKHHDLSGPSIPCSACGGTGRGGPGSV